MSLHYNVAQLLKSEIGQTRAYDFDSASSIDLEGIVASDIRGHVKFSLTNFSIVAVVQADAVLHLTCARCLEPYQSPAHVEFVEEYLPAIDIATGQPSAVPSSDTAFVISQSHTLDLREALRQNLVLAIELIPLCRENCRGLCPTCGVNRNVQPCTCPPADTGSPFAALRGLFVEADAER